MKKTKDEVEVQGFERELKTLTGYYERSTNEHERNYLWKMIQGTQRRLDQVKARQKPWSKGSRRERGEDSD